MLVVYMYKLNRHVKKRFLSSLRSFNVAVRSVDQISSFYVTYTIRYDTIEEFNVDSKAEYTA